ncbi:MAG: PAS domain S-box protein [Nitrospirae bacterium]|jgi:PAS domain S-box-containing protein|nr:PAS domain S-box protein [Nitrospirota bacterium]
MTIKKEPTLLNKPFQLLLLTAVSFFTLEVVVMYLIYFLNLRLSVAGELLLDAVLLTSTGTIVLYYSLFRPMRLHINERKKAEDALIYAFKELNQIFQTSADGMRVIDREFNTIKVNKTFLSIVGAKEDDITGKKCYEIFPGPQCHTANCPMNRILKGEKRIEYESDKIGHGNKKITCIITATPLHNNKGEIIGIVEDFKDITLRKQIEDELHKTKERYKRIVDDIPDFICRYKPDTTITFVNEAYAKYFNTAPEKLVGTSFLNLIPSDFHEVIKNSIRSLNKDNPIVTMEHEVFSPDGLIRWQRWRDRALFDNNGDILEIQSIGQDITEQKHSEEEIKSLKKKIEFVLGATKTGLDIIDSGYIIRYIDPEWQKIYGDYNGKKCYEYFMNSNEICPDCGLKKAFETKSTVVTEKVLKKEGNRSVQVTSIPFQENNSEWLVAQVYVDITERKKMEEERLKMQKLESIGILAGGIAHDFNNILTAILGNISYIKLFTEPDSDIYQPLIMAEEASHRARALTQMLMTFSKGGEPVKKAFNVSKLLRDSARLVLSGSRVRCGFMIKDESLYIEADEGQINQVFNNLIINAMQSMPDGGTVKISAENVTIPQDEKLPLNEGKYVKINIYDEGDGISPENLTRIFDPYFTTRKKGSGLGLTIAYHIIQRHKGYIKVESEQGKGSTFTVYLPASEPKMVVMDQKENLYCPVGKGRILLMDDEDILKDFVCRLLRKVGYEVDTVSDGAEAIEIYKAAKESGKPYDILILDLTVPGGMGGKEAIRNILDFDPEAKAIVSSGYSDDPVMSNYAEHGFKGVVMKPYSIEELTNAIAKIISEAP